MPASISTGELAALLSERFVDADLAKVRQIWLELSRACGVEPLKLREDQVIVEICRAHGWWVGGAQVEAAEGVIMERSHDSPPPERALATVGDVIEYLLKCQKG